MIKSKIISYIQATERDRERERELTEGNIYMSCNNVDNLSPSPSITTSSLSRQCLQAWNHAERLHPWGYPQHLTYFSYVTRTSEGSPESFGTWGIRLRDVDSSDTQLNKDLEERTLCDVTQWKESDVLVTSFIFNPMLQNNYKIAWFPQNGPLWIKLTRCHQTGTGVLTTPAVTNRMFWVSTKTVLAV